MYVSTKVGLLDHNILIVAAHPTNMWTDAACQKKKKKENKMKEKEE